MSIVTTDELKTLTQTVQEGPCVSIYLPTHRAGPETRKNSIRLKNLVTEAEKLLLEQDVRGPDARKLLEPARAMIDNHDIWQHQQDGLALFMAAGLFQSYQTPLRFEELVLVGNRFHLKPLMPLLSDNGTFYLLALSQNQTKLYRGDKFSFEEIDLDTVPQSLAEALRFDEPEKQHQYHTASDTPGSPATGRPAIFHGHGVGTDDEKENILRYFQQIDRGLRDYLAEDDPRPLLLAGVEFLFPIYKKANKYPNLLDEGVTGNPEALSVEDLHEQAWQVVDPYFREARKEAASQYRNLLNSGQASKDIREILPAAHYGQVDTLFVAVDHQQWGTFDPQTDTLQLHDEPQNGDEDLLDLAAVQTLLKGGTIYAVAPEKVPDQAPMAAIFRY